MKKICFTAAALLFLLCGTLFAGSLDNLNYINSLDGKRYALISDAVKMFLMEAGSGTSSVPLDYAVLENGGVKYGAEYKGRENEVLTRGIIARFAAQYLDLGDSLLFSVFGTERYAFRACAAAGIMSADGSEQDKISGPELIEIMSRVSELKGENR